MKTRIYFGRINYNGTGKRYPVYVDVELRKRGGEQTFRMVNGEKVYTGEKTTEYYEFSACATIGARCAGQCLDTVAKFVHTPLFRRIYGYWKAYHLNGMNAGTPEQTKAIEEWKANGNRYDYTKACDYLKEIGLYEVPYFGKSTAKEWNGEMYKYGSAWLVDEIPAPVVADMERIITMGAEYTPA